MQESKIKVSKQRDELTERLNKTFEDVTGASKQTLNMKKEDFARIAKSKQ